MISQIQSFQLIAVSNLFKKAPPVHQTITEQEILLKLITVLSRHGEGLRYKDDLSLFGKDISEVNKRGADKLLYICA